MRQRTFLAFLFVLLFLGGPAREALAVPTPLTVQTPSETAASVSGQSADTANGNSIPNRNGTVFVVLQNSHAVNSSTVTITAQTTTVTTRNFGVLTKGNNVITMAAGTVKIVGPLPRGTWNDSAGNVQLTYTGTGTVLVSPLQLP